MPFSSRIYFLLLILSPGHIYNVIICYWTFISLLSMLYYFCLRPLSSTQSSLTPYQRGKQMLLEGQIFDQYRIVCQLKSGGMGEVYLADDTRLPRQIAIKVIRIDASRHSYRLAAQEATRLFLREAQAIARLDHLHILPLYGSGEKFINGMRLMY